MLDQLETLPQDPRLVAIRFQPEQLTRARELRGLTKAALAALVDKTPGAISQFESGLTKPDSHTVARLGLALAIPVSFFARRVVGPSILSDACHFRSLRSVSQSLRRQAIRIGEIGHEVLALVQSDGVELPKDEISPLKCLPRSPEQIEQLAYDVRRRWGLGAGPIHEVLPLLESKGLRVLPLTAACAEVDAFSTWAEGEPIALLSFAKPSSRVHFDAAHELGHLLMHDDVSPGNPVLEGDADGFASAFLVPRESFLPECPSRWNLRDFQSLKARWRVSIQALVVRAHRLGKLSVASYRNAFIDLNRWGYRQAEPGEWDLMQPVVLRQALELVSDDLPLSRIAKLLCLHEVQLRQVLGPLTPGEAA
ncbi:MAG: ImmA/IrrE family metallo-endopeptidase [Polyangiaceae bacterium]